jgi:uncharacterized damage-inducible protein DinB
MSTERERLVLAPSVGDDPEIGRWLSALEEVRRDTLAVLHSVAEGVVDRDLGDGGDSMGTVLYHVALVEVDWVFTDVLDQPDRIPRDLFPHDDRVEDGHLTPVRGESLSRHVQRLAATRALILGELTSIGPSEYHQARPRERFDVAADWVVFHLIDHEVEHRVRLSALRDGFAGDAG